MTTGTSASPGTGGKHGGGPAHAAPEPTERRRWGTGQGGMRWGAAGTLGPYLLLLVGILVWPSMRDQFLFIAATTAPYATLAVGATWLLVLTLQRGPTRRWTGIAQGLTASLLTYALGAFALGLRWLA